MLQSMTAYGQSDNSVDHGDYCWEIRSVNHRYLDITVRLPEGLRSMDARLREIVSSSVHRGKVDITLKLSRVTAGADRLVVNHRLLEQISVAIDQVQSVRIDAGRCDPVTLLQWPGVVSVQTQLDDGVTDDALEAFGTALTDFLDSRHREGQAITSMLEERASALSQLLARLRHHRPLVVRRQREKLQLKLSQLDMESEPGRLEQELVFAAQRLDIDEELDRLQAHLVELQSIMNRKEAVGRRLDFLMQECNREANTVASKSSDSETTAISIDMKVLIEQIREQVQNIE